MIINKLFHWTQEDAYKTLVETRERQGFSVVNYLYGANLTARKLFAKKKSDKSVRYHKALREWDLLLPDGIGLQLFALLYYRRYHKKKVWLPNLNGTDFLPYCLERLDKEYDLKLVLYGTKPEGIELSAKFLKKKGYDVVYWQDGFREFDRNEFIKCRDRISSVHNKKQIWVMIQGRTTVRDPIQELWVLDNMEKIIKSGLVVFNQSGTFDHNVLGGKEQRAPRIVQTLKLERLWRTLINPKKWRKKLAATFWLAPLVLQKILLKKGC